MKNLTVQVSSFAMLALAALPIASLPASALAAPARVQIADINLLTSEGMQTFAKRADYAARDFCRHERDMSVAHQCRVAVKAELTEKVTAIRAAKLDAASTFAAR
jgi:UrcA family protein